MEGMRAAFQFQCLALQERPLHGGHAHAHPAAECLPHALYRRLRVHAFEVDEAEAEATMCELHGKRSRGLLCDRKWRGVIDLYGKNLQKMSN